MADTKVSAFTQTVSVGATDEVPVLQSGNKRSPMSQVRDYIVGTLGALASKSTVATADIDNNAVTYAKLQDISATARILARKTAGAGDTEEATLSEVLDFIGSAAQGDLLYRGAASWTRLPAGTSGQFLKTLGAGANPAWDTPAGGGSPGGSDTQVQFNDGGAFGGDAGLTYNKTSDTLTASVLTGSSGVNIGATSYLIWSGRARMGSNGTDTLVLYDSGFTGFGRLQFGGTTNAFPSLKRNGTILQARLADDTGDVDFTCAALTAQANSIINGDLRIGSTNNVYWNGRTRMYAYGDGYLRLTNNAGTDFTGIIFGGVSTSFPSLKRSTATLQVRLSDDSGFTKIQGQLQTHANAVAETVTPTHTIVLYDATGTAYRVPCIV